MLWEGTAQRGAILCSVTHPPLPLCQIPPSELMHLPPLCEENALQSEVMVLVSFDKLFQSNLGYQGNMLTPRKRYPMGLLLTVLLRGV